MAQLPVPSDALVVFGVTGDLAFKQIFPALQAMVRHKHLSVPVLGVARSEYNLEQLRDTGAPECGAARQLRARRVSEAVRPASVRGRRL